ncbi:beta-glucosidase-like glycosyl hydrolase [Marinitoga piezophila KA3]|uniref:beta-N-acetylhexosaminidase n=1 Tax=Marinitoga piezophila (strain DSM 14283 / JCM 11233 / KA3) TaxID=443254 RepID=H2J7U2_MARPK|nr:glycoside hydrolase family 3 N-terminal domain-containing protein [Marinitoga piezophila]AEX85433.1 beta-glucosidase-like glycosyl hydrolase [Marinitoga piezophila KA3]
MNYGKLFFLGFPDGLDDEAIEIIKEYKPAGVILYPGNMRSIEELQISMDKLYSLDFPLLITSDHEGGQLETVPGILSSPGNYSIGKVNAPEYAYEYGKYSGDKLKEYGFNMVFSPVLDVLHRDSSAVTGFRIFSDDPRKVAEFGKEYIRGLLDSGILPTAKHFPGHGKAIQDSHEETPVIDDFSFEDEDIFPFEEAINTGIEMIMTAHIIYKSLDKELATVSKKILTDLLREKLKYNGLVISDAIEMKAYYNNYFPEKGVKMFFNNGGDILLIAEARENFKPIYNAFINAVENGEIDKKLLKNKIEKIEKLQKKYYTSEYKGSFLNKIARKALKVSLNEKFELKNPAIFIPKPKNLSQADTTANDLKILEELVKFEFKDANVYSYDPVTGETEEEKFEGNIAISFVLDSFRFSEQLRLQKRLKRQFKKVIYVIIRNDQDEELYESDNHIVTYSTKLISIYQAIRVIKEHQI